MKQELPWVAAGAAVVGTCFLVVWGLSNPSGGIAYDTYQHYYLNLVYAARRVHEGGSGLLWNPLQNLGEPFFGISSSGILYPANVFFLILGPDEALRAVCVTNLTIAGIFAYLLCRTLGTGRLAAACGALSFELGNTMIDVTSWSPMVGGPYVWFPAAMFFCERILQRPAFRDAAALGVALAIALLPGFPQIVFFIYQVIALRVIWEVLTNWSALRVTTFAHLGAGLLLPPLLSAVQFFPGVEMARLSVRGGDLSAAELAGNAITWPVFRRTLTQRGSLFNPILFTPWLLASASFLRAATRRRALFYLAAGALYLCLGMGSETPLYDLYQELPFGRLFRDPYRFFWVTGFCLAVLAGLGADALLSQPLTRPRLRRLSATLLPAVALGGFAAATLSGLVLLERVVGGLVLAATAFVALIPRGRRAAGAFLTLILAVSAFAFHQPGVPRSVRSYASMRSPPIRRLLEDGKLLFTNESLYRRLGESMTPQDRVYLLSSTADFTLAPKALMVVGLSSIRGYEPQPTRRYAEYFTAMRRGVEMRGLYDYYYPIQGMMPHGFNQGLFNLAAGRYLVVDPTYDANHRIMKPPLDLLWEMNQLKVYRNPAAHPRAFWVPRIEVVPEPRALLQRLLRGIDDPRQVALVEEADATDFLGERDGPPGGEAEFLRDAPEDVVIRVVAPRHGFLFLADQFFPGWQASVNGRRVEIRRANYLFRLVEVPAGESTVEFRYVPASLRLGLATTVLSVGGLLAALAAPALRRSRAPAAEPPRPGEIPGSGGRC
jgi:hypothetical protein